MFRKVLKYDMASIRRYWWLIAVAVLAISVVGSVVFRGVYAFYEGGANNDDNVWGALAAMAGIIFLFVCVVAAFSSVVVTTVMTHFRFYRNFFTDEGYLTFTLPVSRKTLYLSKTVNSMFWAFAHVLLLIAGIAVVCTLAPVPESGFGFNFVVWETIGDAVAMLWDQIGGWLFVYVIEALLLYLGSLAMTVGLVQLCVTIGSVIAKKHKLLAAIGIYYAGNMVFSTVIQTFASLFSMFMTAGLFVLMERLSLTGQLAAGALCALLVILVELAVACVLHFVTLGLLERKLNLA